MKYRYAINDKGVLTKCTAPEDKIGVGRCNHSDHQEDGEKLHEFVERMNIKNRENNKYKEGTTKNNKAFNRPHNRQGYEAITESLNNGDKAVSIVHGTGTGKSVIVSAVAEDYENEDVLLLVPNNGIKDQYNKFGFDQNKKAKHFNITYSKLVSDDKNNRLNQYKNVSIIFLDEFHRTGSSKWEQSLENLRKVAKNAKIVGVTATPTREDQKYTNENMIGKMFNNNCVSEFPLKEGIRQGAIEMPEYKSVPAESLDTLKKEREKLINNDKIGERNKSSLLNRIDNILDNENKDSLKINAFKESLLPRHKENDKNGKGSKILVFCNSSKEIDQDMIDTKAQLQESLGEYVNINIGAYYHKQKDGGKESYQNFVSEEDVPKGEVQALFVIDKFNEGVHVDNLDGIAMIRNVKSDIVYNQQIGRSFSSESENSPIVFDFASNDMTNDRVRDWDDINVMNMEEKDANSRYDYKGREKYDDLNNIIYDIKEKEGKKIINVNGSRGTLDEHLKKLYGKDSYDFKAAKESIKEAKKYYGNTRSYDDIVKMSSYIPKDEFSYKGTRGTPETIAKIFDRDPIDVKDKIDNGWSIDEAIKGKRIKENNDNMFAKNLNRTIKI